MNIEKNQILKVKRFFFVMAFVGFCAFVIFPSWTRIRSEDKLVNAQRQAEVVGYQVFEIYREVSAESGTLAQESSGRSPSSIATESDGFADRRESGSIGGDPWGQPYRYKILTAGKDHLKVQIWSAGPNKTFETKDEPGIASEEYSGDDVGIVLSMASKSPER